MNVFDCTPYIWTISLAFSVYYIGTISVPEDKLIKSGLVRSPAMTTIMQVSSRFLLVWFIVYPFPELAQSPVYTSMVIAWSVTEIVRYTYFYRLLSSGQSSLPAQGRFDAWFSWLR